MARAGAGQRGIDHLVLAVRDLAKARALYEALGFTLTPRALHPWGTANHLAQMQGCFLEILGVAEPDRIAAAAPGGFGFGAYNRDFLARRDGMSMLVLTTADAAADEAAFRRAGLATFPTFHFDRDATLPDGSVARVAFTLAFVADPGLPEAVFFTCQQHAPQHFWKPQFQRHDNGAQRIAEVVLRAEAPRDLAGFLAKVCGTRRIAACAGGIRVPLRGGALTVLTPDGCERRFPGMRAAAMPPTPHFAAYRIAGCDPDALANSLARAAISYRRTADAVQVPPAAGFGVAIELAAG
jgi:catechol 2,3-dioxygenase-like lactoylglutathione lyase family enzyme